VIVVRDGDERARHGPCVVTIGVFDGLHRGHQRVIEQVVALARELDALATVVTFEPHPALVLDHDRAPRQLGTLDQRVEGLARLGVDIVRVITFSDEVARESASAFVQRVLVDELGAVVVVVGEDFRFGHDRLGDVALLRREGERHHFDVRPAVIFGDGQRWSSTSVRQSLASGDVARAAVVLGRPFTLRGVVVRGDQRGGDLGFPTANVSVAAHQMLPELGVYAGAVRLEDGQWLPAAISVGTRPQFYENGEVLVEVHVVGYAGDLYGSTLDVAFLGRLRAEMTFPDVDALIAQMESDVLESVAIFENFSPEASILLG